MGRDLSDPLTSRRMPLVGCSRPTPGARGLGQERFLCFCRTPFWGGHFPVSSHVPVPSPCPQFIQQTCFHHQTDARLAPSPGNTVTRWWPHLKGDGLAQRVGCLSRGSPRSSAVDRDFSEEGSGSVTDGCFRKITPEQRGGCVWVSVGNWAGRIRGVQESLLPFAGTVLNIAGFKIKT